MHYKLRLHYIYTSQDDKITSDARTTNYGFITYTQVRMTKLLACITNYGFITTRSQDDSKIHTGLFSSKA